MSPLAAELVPWLQYATPPLVGAFIGYLTNRVAIRMLFRPLRAWRLFGKRVPLTPGVIPAKRRELARNMGEVVGDHLLTGAEISRGLEHPVFQEHLAQMISTRVEGLMQRDLGTLGSLVPARFQVYFALGSQTINYQLKQQVQRLARSPEVSGAVAAAVDRQLDLLLAAEVDAICGAAAREELYRQLQHGVAAMLASPALSQWLEDFVRARVYAILQQEKKIADLLPPFLLELLLATLERQVPLFLRQLSVLVEEKEVQDRVVQGVCGAVAAFIDSLGGMAEMVRGFVRMERVEVKVRDYLLEHRGEIVAWLTSAEIEERVVGIIRTRGRIFFDKPIVTMVRAEDEAEVNAFCGHCSTALLRLLRGGGCAAALSSLLAGHLEEQLAGGRASLGEILARVLGDSALPRGRQRLQEKIGEILAAESTRRGLDSLVDRFFAGLRDKKIGKLAAILPPGVRQGLVEQLQQLSMQMLASELPGLVQSLNIRRIVTERINGLDLLKLEGLLLAIMAEQFKYINLFGAVLGFLIGCLNLLLLRL
jgi:uncharacterized membrane protein YheB (UPF0754 family)